MMHIQLSAQLTGSDGLVVVGAAAAVVLAAVVVLVVVVATVVVVGGGVGKAAHPQHPSDEKQLLYFHKDLHF